MVFRHLRPRRHPCRVHGIQAGAAAVLPSLRIGAPKTMKRIVAITTAIFLCACGAKGQVRERPKIIGIGSVRITSSFVEGNAIGFYVRDLGFGGGRTVCEGASKLCMEVNNHQRIDLYVPRAPGTNDELSEIAFETTDAVGIRNQLLVEHLNVGPLMRSKESNLYFVTQDPDGHGIGFIQYLKKDDFSHPLNQVSGHLLHVGFVVRNQKAMEHFYKDILGFKPYWHGGMKDDQTDWEALQVPNGTDWVEFMLNVPLNADKHTLGVMNHIALGVPDIHAAAKQLLTNGMTLTEEPKIGRDGKWQLNLYDPDQTRVELMEFTPVEKPCCSDYTGPHPKP